MRRGLPYLIFAGITLLAFLVLLPVLGVVLLLALLALGLLVGFMLAAPLLARLPWFRNRIHVKDVGGRKTIRFGGAVYTSYRGEHGHPQRQPPDSSGRLDDGDVIEAEFRELPERDDDKPEA